MMFYELTEAHKAALRAQTIDADQPGSVLHDFQVVLDFLGTEGVPAAGKYNLLPISAIAELNARLRRPLRLQLKRPLLVSHPYLQGLNLLLRASGLTEVAGTGAKTRLTINPMLAEQWRQLNPTERYFNLLEAFLRVGRPEMVGGRRATDDFLSACLSVLGQTPPAGKKIRPDLPQPVYLYGIAREFYVLALMDLFGLVAIEHPRKPVSSWYPAAIHRVPFGDAIVTLIGSSVFSWMRGLLTDDGAAEAEESNEPTDEEYDFECDEQLGQWQPLLQPYFPAWQRNLVLPPVEERDGTFIFRVSLGKTWRRLAMPADATLATLVAWILKSVNFDGDHLFEISYRNRLGHTVRAMHEYCDEGPAANDIRLGEIPLQPGESMHLTYDFGDNWQFKIKLEAIEPPGKKPKPPRILERHGKAPKQYSDDDSWDD